MNGLCLTTLTLNNLIKIYFRNNNIKSRKESLELATFTLQNRYTDGHRGGSRTVATSKMELFVIIVNGFQSLTIFTKCSILDVAAVLDPPLGYVRLCCYWNSPLLIRAFRSSTNWSMHIYVIYNWIMVKIQPSVKYSEFHVNYFKIFSLITTLSTL